MRRNDLDVFFQSLHKYVPRRLQNGWLLCLLDGLRQATTILYNKGLQDKLWLSRCDVFCLESQMLKLDSPPDTVPVNTLSRSSRRELKLIIRSSSKDWIAAITFHYLVWEVKFKEHWSHDKALPRTTQKNEHHIANWSWKGIHLRKGTKRALAVFATTVRCATELLH